MKIAKTNIFLKSSVTKLFPIEINETDILRKQKLRREAAQIGELKSKYQC